MKLSAIQESGRRSEQGAWVKKLAPFDGLALKVRGRFNTDYVRRAKELFEAEPEENRPGGLLRDDASQRHDRVLLAETVLTDWRGLEDDEGQPIPYSVERARQLIDDPDSPAFRGLVNYAASIVSTEGQRDEKAAEGN